MAVLKRLQTSDPGRDGCADPIRLARDVQAGIPLGQPCRSDDQVREAVHAPCLLAVDELGRIEALHLAREMDRVPARIELGDLTRSRPACDQVLPASLDVVPERGQGTEA